MPDVAAAASPASGWLVRDGGGWSNVGGTSAATPFWAASMLLAEQYARAAGRDAALLPRADPLHARLDAAAVPALPRRAWSAATATTTRRQGWDYATGLGSPDVWNLARDLTAYLRTHPCGPGS